MGKGQQQKKSNGKRSPVEQDPLEPILKEFREEYATDTSGSQWVTFFVMGALTTASIIHLFTTPLLVTVAPPQLAVLIVTGVVAALLLAVSYNEISKRKLANLISSRDLVSKDIPKSDFNAAIQTETSMYALFTTNATYLFGALTFAFYILPTYGLGDDVACGIAAVVPALFLFALAKSGRAF